jgi:Flp pilus assembly protein TadB
VSSSVAVAGTVVFVAGTLRAIGAFRRRHLINGRIRSVSELTAAGTQRLRAPRFSWPRKGESGPTVSLVEALGIINRSVGSGASLAVAISDAAVGMQPGQVRSSLERIHDESGRVGLVSALQGWGASDTACRRVAWALAVSVETGGDPQHALDALTDTLRTELALDRELGALTAQSRLSAAVLAMVPIGFGALMTGTDAAARHFLLATALGRLCLLIGLTFEVVAWKWLTSIATVIR